MITFLCRNAAVVWLTVLAVVGMGLRHASAAALFEEGFNYSAGSGLATNSPWAGNATSNLTIASGNLSQSNLQATFPAGNLLQITGGASRSAYSFFTAAPITTNSVYCSMLVSCSAAASNSQTFFVLGRAGATNSGGGDPLDLSVRNSTNGPGYNFSATSDGSDPATPSTIVPYNTTHFLVVKCTFTNRVLTNAVVTNAARISIYLDPVPGAAEPSRASASTSSGDDGITTVSNAQSVIFRSPSTAQTALQIDTVRVGTNWSDVTPQVTSPVLSGPLNQITCAGSPVTFNIGVAGAAPYTFAWLTNGVPIAAASNSSYTIPSPTPADGLNTYSVVVQNAYGVATSAVASLGVSSIPAGIASPPTNAIVWPGTTNVSFTVSASGDAPLSYQWQTNGVPVAGATTSSYTVSNAAAADPAVGYDVVVSNPCGTATGSPPATVTFPHQFYWADSLPGFFSGLNLFVTNVGGLSMFTWSSPDSTLPVSQWTLEGLMQEQPLNDGTGNSRYSINVTPAVSPVYYLVGTATTPPYLSPAWVQWITTDDSGNYSYLTNTYPIAANGVLQLPAPPSITQQPVSQTVTAGKTVTYAAIVTGTDPLSYQWFFYSNVVSTNVTLLVGNVTAANAGRYYLIVTNAYGAATSSVANLAVVARPQLASQPGPRGFQLSAAGIAGDVYVIQAATSFLPAANWISIATNVAGANGLIQFLDTNSGLYADRFYRLASPVNAPALPIFVQQPAPLAVVENRPANFNLTVSGAWPLGIQWYRAGPLQLPNATNNSFTIAPATTSDAGAYFAVASNAFGSVTSSVVSLAVIPPPPLSAASAAGQLRLSAPGAPGLVYCVQTASTLMTPVVWTTIATNTVGSNGLVQFAAPGKPGSSLQFYRLLFP